MYHISIERKKEFFFCRITGENSVDNVINYLRDIHDAMEKQRGKKVLIEENLSEPSLNLINMYQIIHTAKRTVLALPYRIAYVDINHQHNHTSLRFAETVALNRWIKMKLFTNINDAEERLHKE
jgi:hypothetical protein